MIRVSNYHINEQDIISSGKIATLYKATKLFPLEPNHSASYSSLPQDEYFVIKRVDTKYLPSCITEISTLQKLSTHYDKFNEIVDSFSTPNHIYLVYRYYNQKSLDEFIHKDEESSLDLVLDYMGQIIEAFKILKTLGIIHRDIRPNNIVINNDSLKITGFYSAIHENGQETSPFLLASPLCMSPELLTSFIIFS